MLKIDRQRFIEEALLKNGSILVTDACSLLNCSDQTIRRDLQEMEESGKLKRIHGGAYLPTVDDKGVPIQLRAHLIPKEKEHIAGITVDNYVDENDLIMMDSSTTCLTMAKEILLRNLHVTIITNSLSIVSLFDSAPQSAQLICIGGYYKDRSKSFVGDNTISSLSGFVADKTFISCNALDIKHGLLDNNDRQKEIRKTMFACSRQHYLLVDHTKFGDCGNYIISDFSSLDGIITDQKPSRDWLACFETWNLDVSY